MSLQGSTEPALAWVIVAGEPRHVSEFASLPPSGRPASLCPQCGRALTLKLGAHRRHHAAHQPGWTCPSVRMESALHINCKLSLAAVLRATPGDARLLRIRQRCAGAGGVSCNETLERDWSRGWTTVDVEPREHDDIRPDLMLARGGAPIGAIEILASHAIPVDKAALFARSGLPWIEVAASPTLAEPHAWNPAQPLDVVRADDAEPWRCATHTARHAAEVARVEQEHVAQRERARESTTLRSARVVDVYHPGGSRERIVYRVLELRRDGLVYGRRLTRGTRVVAEAANVEQLRDAYRTDIERLCGMSGAFADSPMRWAGADAAEFIVNEGAFDQAAGERGVLATTYPRRWFYSPRDARWFLPAEMNDVRWDRPPGDLFAPHPAWTGRRGVRERPAPEGSWATLVFARRPLAAMFTAGLQAVSNDDGIAWFSLENSNRTIVVIERTAVRPSAIEDMRHALGERDRGAVWLSHPRDWRPCLDGLAWAAAGRDARGYGAVVIDGVGVYRADAFVRAVRSGDPRLGAERIREASAARIAVLRGSHPERS